MFRLTFADGHVWEVSSKDISSDNTPTMIDLMDWLEGNRTLYRPLADHGELISIVRDLSVIPQP